MSRENRENNMKPNESISGEHISENCMSGERIHELRNILSISAESFGRRCNITHRHLLRIEGGDYPVTEELAQRIQDEFDVPIEWLTGKTDELLINSETTAVDRLEEVLRESGLSQSEFCRRLGASKATLSLIFAGKHKVTTNLALRIESVFHIGADWLLYGDENAKECPLSNEMVLWLKKHPEKREIVWSWMNNCSESGGSNCNGSGPVGSGQVSEYNSGA